MLFGLGRFGQLIFPTSISIVISGKSGRSLFPCGEKHCASLPHRGVSCRSRGIPKAKRKQEAFHVPFRFSDGDWPGHRRVDPGYAKHQPCPGWRRCPGGTDRSQRRFANLSACSLSGLCTSPTGRGAAGLSGGRLSATSATGYLSGRSQRGCPGADFLPALAPASLAPLTLQGRLAVSTKTWSFWPGFVHLALSPDSSLLGQFFLASPGLQVGRQLRSTRNLSNVNIGKAL